MACRGADLIVAVGQELRIADLLECKEVASRVMGGGSVMAGQLHYKVRSVIFVISMTVLTKNARRLTESAASSVKFPDPTAMR